MYSKNYKLYRTHKTELFEMFYEVCRNAPLLPIFPTEEQIAEHKKQMDKYLESRRPEIISKLQELGFGKESLHGSAQIQSDSYCS